ncbi:hypothetical protein H4W00_000731 [Psychrobacter sp. PL19]|uniref:AIPR family protein n=1 Tax=Psychrobacter sp. PL19 TaxID=2760711 RepID=UPI001AE36266
MVNINDFKVLNKISLNYFETLVHESFNEGEGANLSSLTDLQKSRLGFNILVVEQLTELSDYIDIADCIIDTEFNKVLYGQISDDFGVDAVVFEDEDDEKHIKLFNFKYRENLKEGKKGVNETLLSVKFLNAIHNNDFTGMTGKPLDFAKKICEKYSSNEVWKITLYVVSNENSPSEEIDSHLRQFKTAYDMDIIEIGLSQIADLISLRPTPVSSTILLDRDAVMSFTEDSLSSSKSYIFRLSLAELIRITSKDSGLRNEYNIEDLSRLSETTLDTSVLFDNVRGFVLKSKFNKNIANTVKVNPTKFFMYNNGLTLIANDVIAEYTNGGKKIKITLSDFQVLNGGQTLRTAHDFNRDDSNNITDYLCDSEVLVRVFKTQKDSELNSKIAEFTNSQNAISNVDLRSLRKEQMDLEKYLQLHDILYSRKTGDTGIKQNKSYRLQISMEKFGQILMAQYGMPEKSVNQKKKIFDKYYDLLFVNNDSLIDDSVKQIELFQKIREAYKRHIKYDPTDQKIFYIVHITLKGKLRIQPAIEFLETTLDEYISSLNDNNISKARILIQIKFKNFLEDKLQKKLEEDVLTVSPINH